MKLFKILIIPALVLFAGCASKDFKPFEPDPIKFEKTPDYKVDTSKLDDLLKGAIEKQYTAKEAIIHDDGKVEFLPPGSKLKPTHVVLLPAEFKEVANIVDIAMAYRDTTLAEEGLINTHIATVNSLKELAEMERQKVLIYREQWVNSENLYRHEAKVHRRDNLVNDVKFWLVTVGSVAGFAMAL